MAGAEAVEECALCGRPLGIRTEKHHPVPRSRGGRETVPVHPICHRAIHAAAANGELARMNGDMDAVRALPDIALCPLGREQATRLPRTHAARQALG